MGEVFRIMNHGYDCEKTGDYPDTPFVTRIENGTCYLVCGEEGDYFSIDLTDGCKCESYPTLKDYFRIYSYEKIYNTDLIIKNERGY